MRALSDEQIRELVEDWYHTKSVEDVFGLSSVAKDVRELLVDAGEDINREEALRVVDALLRRGMLAGTSPYHPEGYQPWADQNRDAVIHRIRSEWLQLGREPHLHEIAWFGPPE